MLINRIKTKFIRSGLFNNEDDFYNYYHHFKELKQTNSFTNKNVFDIGCGDGKFLIFVSVFENPSFCLGLDLESKRFYNDYLKKLHIDNIELIEGDIINFYSEDMKFDIITANYSLHHIFTTTENLLKSENLNRSLLTFLNKIHSLLKINGVFIIKEITKLNLCRYWPFFAENVGLGGIDWNTKHSPNEFIQLLKMSNFKKIKVYFSIPYPIRKYRIMKFKKFLTNHFMNFFLCSPYYIYAQK